MFPPERIICLTEETVETLYLLGEDSRIVGISGYVVRPPRARREKPRVSAFTSADIPKILDLKPDLVLTFSDLQADIAAALIRAHVDVHAFNQRTIVQILDMIRVLGALVGAADRAERLVGELAATVGIVRKRAAQSRVRPRVYFEEWDEPMISGIGWVSELIEAAGGIDVFSDRQVRQGAHRDGRGSHPQRAGYHHGLVVRQEISRRKARQEARLWSYPGGEVWRAARDQVAFNPTTGSGRPDRWSGRLASDHSGPSLTFRLGS